jgi:hypothetical protein
MAASLRLRKAWREATRGGETRMGLFGSVALIALGAILLWGVDASVAGVGVNTIGAILMVVGGIGGLLSLVLRSRSRGFGGRSDGEEEHLTTLPR